MYVLLFIFKQKQKQKQKNENKKMNSFDFIKKTFFYEIIFSNTTEPKPNNHFFIFIVCHPIYP